MELTYYVKLIQYRETDVFEELPGIEACRYGLPYARVRT